MPPVEVCERARLARDPRFDGLFFVAVLTTGVYCRPVCPARQPAQQNVRYFRSAAAAQDAGYRPCMRCRPEYASLPAFSIGSQTAIRALGLINAGMLNDQPVTALASRVGVGVRQLNRLFHDELGAPPKSIARMQRAVLARQLIDHTAMPFSVVAHVAGYRSQRRFNDEIQSTFQRSPSELRHQLRVLHTPLGARAQAHPLGRVVLRLPVRQPYRAEWVIPFLARRGIPGLEVVVDGVYKRRLPPVDAAAMSVEADGWLEARLTDRVLEVSLPAAAAGDAARLLARVRRIFDLDADPEPVDRHLATSPRLAPLVATASGIRVPGAWDAFELAVRAILGQQVSVDRATHLSAQLVERFGEGGQFPSADRLAREDPAVIGIPGSRGRAISTLAKCVVAQHIDLAEGLDSARLRAALAAVPGIGPWTAEYIALRAGRDPDAFPDSDWVVLKVLDTTAAGARRIAEAWRPWRGYALMYLWLDALRQRTERAKKTALSERASARQRKGTTA